MDQESESEFQVQEFQELQFAKDRLHSHTLQFHAHDLDCVVCLFAPIVQTKLDLQFSCAAKGHVLFATSSTMVEEATLHHPNLLCEQ